MRELAFAGLTDGGDLLLTAGDGQQYSLAVDDRLVAAVRGDRPRLGQLSIALEGASPRDIQTRIRHGQSPEDISEQTGIAIERVTRFAGPPLAERAHVAELARGLEVRRGEEPLSLAESLQQVLSEAGADPEHLEWDAWRREDGRWTVVARWAGATEAPFTVGEAGWAYDQLDRTLEPEGEVAHLLQHGVPAPPEPAPLMRLVVRESETDLEGPAAPWGEPTPAEVDRQVRAWDAEAAARPTQIVDRYSGEVLDLADGPPEQPDTPLDDLLMTDPGVTPAHAKPSRRERRKGRPAARDAGQAPPAGDAQARTRPRAVVPSWDEILFGTRKPEDPPPAQD